jgi:hypothetical protein
MEFKSEPERNFEAFRPLARHILSSLRDREKADLLDPLGPLPELARQAQSGRCRLTWM